MKNIGNQYKHRTNLGDQPVTPCFSLVAFKTVQILAWAQGGNGR